jgi:predicted RNA-binding Zn ribbon-like protein
VSIQDQPGGREPAPGRLELVQAFVNTNDIEGRRDRLGRPELARACLRERGLLGRQETVNETELELLRKVREAIRALALANNGFPSDVAMMEVLDEAARCSIAVRFTTGGLELHPAGVGARRAVGELLAIVADSMSDGTWPRMKACRRDICRWLFYDHSRNRSSIWCSMAICGNRTKTRAYRRRRAE